MDKTSPIRSRREREGALIWLAFLALCVIGVAAVISGAIRHAFDTPGPAGVAAPDLSHRPSPAPPPLPGSAPNGRVLDGSA